MWFRNTSLGSTRLMIGLAQQVKECTNYLPFGEQSTDTCSPVGSGNTHKFTGHERDPESSFVYNDNSTT